MLLLLFSLLWDEIHKARALIEILWFLVM